MMYYSRENGRNSFDIYVAYRLSDTSWSEPVNLGAPVNTDGWEAQRRGIGRRYTFVLLLLPVREGEGEADIWFSYLLRREADGRQLWSQPRCLYFNTGGDEMAPFLYFDNKTLFFASTDMRWMGRKDIYKVDVEQVTPPLNIGYYSEYPKGMNSGLWWMLAVNGDIFRRISAGNVVFTDIG